MADTTALGFVFPEATDDVNLWEHFEALAVSINDYIASHGRVATAVVDTDSPTFTTSEASLGALVAPLVSGRTYKVGMILHIGTTVANDWGDPAAVRDEPGRDATALHRQRRAAVDHRGRPPLLDRG